MTIIDFFAAVPLAALVTPFVLLIDNEDVKWALVCFQLFLLIVQLTCFFIIIIKD